MQELVRQAMREGALGVGTSLIYAPASYAKTDELIALASAAGEFGGGYISHMRSEGDRFIEALDELIRISREAKVHAQAYHLKAAGQKNWPKMREAIAKIEAARKAGLPITADMYPYTAGATGLDAAMPPWVQQGGIDGWVAQLKKPDVRKRVIAEMRDPNANWESLLLAAGSPERVLLIGFKTEKLKPLTGKTLAEVAKMRGVSPEDAAIDLVIEDHTRVGTAYFLMSEENVKLGLSQPWVNIGSDAGDAGAGRPVPAEQPASARLRHVRALPRPLRARPEGDDAAGRDSAPDAPAGGELQAARIAVAWTRAASPTSSCSIRRRSTTSRRSTSRTSTRSAWCTCS